MLEINLLGTGGMVPLPERFLTSLMVRHNGRAVLIDCGEGTQVAIRAAGLKLKQIDAICLTHFHADHVAGLPGLLLTMGNSGKAEPLRIIGPKHVRQVVECLLIIAPKLPFTVEYIEIDAEKSVPLWDSLTLTACPVEHRIPCFAYKLELSRQGKFDAELAKSLDIPVKLWSVLQSGQDIEVDGVTIQPRDIMGKPRKGLKLCYATDLRPSERLPDFARGSDLFVCEGNYGDPEKLDKAIEHSHCMFSEAAEMAARAGVSELWLTHFSPSMPDPAEFLSIATGIFPNSSVDKTAVTLRFLD